MQTIALKGRVIAGAAALAAILLTAGHAHATGGNCSPTKSRFVTGASIQQTTSQTYVSMPGTTAKFTQGGTKTSCVIVFLSIWAGTVVNESMLVKPILLSGAVSNPDETRIITNAPTLEQRTVMFVFPTVAPGKQELRFQYRSFGGALVNFQSTNVLVQYAP
jgi:hypothetical protein